MAEPKKPLDERWSRYPETVLHFQGEPPVMIDLRVEIGPSLRQGLAALKLDSEFAVLTAFNPRGVDAGDQDNKSRMKELEAELGSVGYDFVRLDACSPDKSHCECSVAVKTSLADSVALAKRWEQIAIFWFDGSAFWLYGAIVDMDPVQLPIS